MNSKGCLPTVIGSVIVIAIVIWLFKVIVTLGIIGSIIAAIYFAYLAYKQPENRQKLLKGRVLPAIIVMIICGGIIGMSSNSHSSSSSEEASSSSKVSSSSSSKKESSSSDDEDDEDDESSSSDYDDSSSEDTNSDSNSDSNESTTEESDANTNTDGNGTSVSNHGDMTTDSKGVIVGNSRTMIYHTPDQHGYRMNSSNAVYFNSEAEAQAAGYRKALQ